MHASGRTARCMDRGAASRWPRKGRAGKLIVRTCARAYHTSMVCRHPRSRRHRPAAGGEPGVVAAYHFVTLGRLGDEAHLLHTRRSSIGEVVPIAAVALVEAVLKDPLVLPPSLLVRVGHMRRGLIQPPVRQHHYHHADRVAQPPRPRPHVLLRCSGLTAPSTAPRVWLAGGAQQHQHGRRFITITITT
jgi:hypothetical protein